MHQSMQFKTCQLHVIDSELYHPGKKSQSENFTIIYDTRAESKNEWV